MWMGVSTSSGIAKVALSELGRIAQQGDMSSLPSTSVLPVCLPLTFRLVDITRELGLSSSLSGHLLWSNPCVRLSAQVRSPLYSNSCVRSSLCSRAFRPPRSNSPSLQHYVCILCALSVRSSLCSSAIQTFPVQQVLSRSAGDLFPWTSWRLSSRL